VVCASAGVFGDDVRTGPGEQGEDAPVGERVAGDGVVMGGDDQESHPPGLEIASGSVEQQSFGAFDIGEDEVDVLEVRRGHQ
jgi:hypothetical protein